ncbi:hypothetical protein ACFZAG_38995 [Streptomyces sp. NPDC012403]|uniref:hypothetical protein n=1 Tax=unclassified Streptomyces TaxID=2593676 RepID=UPI001C2182BF|nr:hypothetical protein [Streptomyces sp. AC558_RSS880]
MLGRTLCTFAAAILLSGAALVATPHEARAADFCGWRPLTTDRATAMVLKAGAAVHDGPLAKCPIQDRLGEGGSLTNILCQYVNDRYRNLWYYADEGWVYSPYLENVTGESVPTCPWP